MAVIEKRLFVQDEYSLFTGKEQMITQKGTSTKRKMSSGLVKVRMLDDTEESIGK